MVNSDPWKVLGVSAEDDDETIRRRYLELVRQFSPEQAPEQFARIRQAWEQLRDLETRVRHRILEPVSTEALDSLIEETACRISRRRITLQILLDTLKNPG